MYNNSFPLYIAMIIQVLYILSLRNILNCSIKKRVLNKRKLCACLIYLGNKNGCDIFIIANQIQTRKTAANSGSFIKLEMVGQVESMQCILLHSY